MSNCSIFNFQKGSCQNLNIGFDFKRALTYKNSSGVVNDLTGLTFTMVIKSALGGTTLLTLAEVGDAITTGLYIPAPTTGVINILITDASGVSATAGNYVYEITYTQTNGLKFPFMQGAIQFIDSGF